jgi:hypothetical protein
MLRIAALPSEVGSREHSLAERAGKGGRGVVLNDLDGFDIGRFISRHHTRGRAGAGTQSQCRSQTRKPLRLAIEHKRDSFLRTRTCQRDTEGRLTSDDKETSEHKGTLRQRPMRAQWVGQRLARKEDTYSGNPDSPAQR